MLSAHIGPQTAQELINMNIYLLTLSSIFLAVGVLTAIDGIVLVSGMSGIMFCLSIIGESIRNPDPHR
jgi:hypothetical protein